MTKNTEKQTINSNNTSDHIRRYDRDHWISLNGKKINQDSKSPIGSIPRLLVVRQVEHPAGHYVPMHSHSWGQLLSISEGLMQVSIKGVGHWVVPPHRAVWIPAFIEHDAKAMQNVRMKNVYIAPNKNFLSSEQLPSQQQNQLPEQCQVIAITPLIKELINSISQLDTLYNEQGADGRLVQVLLDQLKSVPQLPLHLPLPKHKALLHIADTLKECRADNRSLKDWASELGYSERTLARYFKTETGMTFGQWRQQSRLLIAITRIAKGDSIANIAQDLGYNNQSAFIAMFKKALGKTPGKYFEVD